MNLNNPTDVRAFMRAIRAACRTHGVHTASVALAIVEHELLHVAAGSYAGPISAFSIAVLPEGATSEAHQAAAIIEAKAVLQELRAVLPDWNAAEDCAINPSVTEKKS